MVRGRERRREGEREMEKGKTEKRKERLTRTERCGIEYIERVEESGKEERKKVERKNQM